MLGVRDKRGVLLRICQRDYWREVFEHSHDEYSRFARGIVRDSNTLGLG